MRCDKCKYWTASKDNHYYLPTDAAGECSKLFDHDNVDIQVEAGWGGGYVSKIETKCSFYCANFKVK